MSVRNISDDNLIPPPEEGTRFPFCVVWTPIPGITWICPLIGHIGIASSSGKIRDFAGPYYVAEDNMAFGKPTKYWKLDLNKVKGKENGWDESVKEASLEYGGRIHNLFWDNCHSHVGLALNLMEYNGCKHWNMAKLALFMFLNGKYVGKIAWCKTWLPFILLVLLVLFFIFFNQIFTT